MNFLRAVIITLMMSALGSSLPAIAQAQPLLLKAHASQEEIVTAQRRVLGFTVRRDERSGRMKIGTVFMGSSAWNQGLTPGDDVVAEIIHERNDGVDATITVLRDGNRQPLALTTYGDYRHFLAGGEAAAPLRLARPSAPPAQPVQRAEQPMDVSLPRDERPVFSINVQDTVQERTRAALQGRDLVVLIDRSGSMSTTDCPQAASRWDWCRQQTMRLSAGINEILPKGFCLVLFNSRSKVTENVDAGAIAEAFQNNKPEGGTDTAGALIVQLKAYGDRKKAGAAKPLVLVVISDGAPNDPNKLRNTLISAANDMTLRNELSVVFVQVGEDNQASAYLDDMAFNLNQEGAKFNIARTIQFDYLKRRGLLPALAEALAPEGPLAEN